MIYFIGDSHSSVFSGAGDRKNPFMQPVWGSSDYSNQSVKNIDEFDAYRIGPATAYQLASKVGIIDKILKQKVKDDDSVFFCFGEVDVRAHLKKQMDIQKVSVEDIVKECVDRYFEVILRYKNMGYKMGVWGPIASNPSSLPYSGPIFGTCKERNEITKEFNRYVSELCSKNDVLFISIFDEMVDSSNETKPEYIMDHIHLSQSAMPIILDKFKNNNLI